MKEKINNFFKLLKERRKIVISNPSTFQQKFAVSLSRGAYISLLIFITLLIGFISYLVISYTSLKKFIPGYPNIENADQIYETDLQNMEMLSEFEEEAKQRDLWIKNLQAILLEKDSVLFSDVVDSIKLDSNYKNIVFERPVEDSIVRAEVEKQEELIKVNEIKGVLKQLNFLLPVAYKKFIASSKTSTFITEVNAPIMACMKGIVVSKSGRTIVIQHQNSFLSIYKNCDNIRVESGEEISRGRELGEVKDSIFNFELWHDGKTINIKKASSK